MSTIEREAFAVIYALRKFRNFVFATEVTIFSDHNPLMYLRECAPKSARLTRWALGLQEFNIIWSYRPGSRNQARVDGKVTVSDWVRVNFPERRHQ